MNAVKYLALFIALLIICGNAQAQTPQKKVNVTHAIIFLRGAELESKTQVSLPQGESEMILTNIANNINEQSINIGTTNDVVIQSITYQSKPAKKTEVSTIEKRINDSIEILAYQRATYENKLKVIKSQLDIINVKSAAITTDTSMSNMQTMLKLIDARMPALLDQQQQTNKQIGDILKQHQQLLSRLNEERQKENPLIGQLLVKLYAPQATTSDIIIRYVMPSAGWNPNYDLRVTKVNQPVQLVYKAKVFQQSGLNWDKIKITLSTGNPSESAEAPILTPQRLSFSPPHSTMPAMTVNTAALNVQSSFKRKSSKEIAAAEVAMDEDLITEGVNNYVKVDNSGINTSFDIDLPYTIPSDGKEYVVNVKTYNVPATYRYYAVPRLDQDVFLQARLTNWGTLNLLPAATNIFYEGFYVGEGRIDTRRSVNDTLNISLGRDKKIVVRRNRSTDYRAPKTFSSNVQEWYGYTIEANNTKSEPISLTIIDQFPVSKDKDITVDDMQAIGAETSAETGAIRWITDLQPNTSKKFEIKYSVKYPKDKTVYGL